MACNEQEIINQLPVCFKLLPWNYTVYNVYDHILYIIYSMWAIKFSNLNLSTKIFLCLFSDNRHTYVYQIFKKDIAADNMH